jgi:hypothetical protein
MKKKVRRQELKRSATLTILLFVTIGYMTADVFSDEAIQAYTDALKAYDAAAQQLQRANLRAQKKEIIKKVIQLTSEQSRMFWTIYDKYEMEVIKLNDTRLALIADYVDHREDISAEKATELINQIMQLQLQRQESKRGYVKELGKVLTAKQALRLLLLEQQIDVQIDAQIAAQIPL